MSEATPKFLELALMQPVFTDIEGITGWLKGVSPEVAEHFSDRLREEIRTMRARFASEIAASSNGRMTQAPDHDASVHYARPVYRYTFATSKTRRRSSTGRYNIYFSVSGDTDGKPDTLTIYRVRHAGASDGFAVPPPPARE